MTKISVDLTNTPKLKLLSHSSISTLNRCARKYEIYKLNLLSKEPATVDTAFGHAVGAGIQSLLVTEGDIGAAKLAAFLAWSVPLDWDLAKSKKSFALACTAIDVFAAQQLPEILAEWKVLVFNDKPMIELGFLVQLPDDYVYRGFIDVVLVHREFSTLKVLELKTTKFTNVHPAAYRNSFQGVGYGIILDAISTELNLDSDFYVDYLVYQTGNMNFLPLPFLKTFYQRAKWLSTLTTYCKMIDLYIATGVAFPMNGDSCYDFFRPCAYYGMCESDNEDLVLHTSANSMSDEAFAESFLSTDLSLDIPLDTCDNVNTEKELNDSPKYIEEVDYVITYEDLVANQVKQLNNFHNASGTIPMREAGESCELQFF